MASLLVIFRPSKIIDTKTRKDFKFESISKKLDRRKKDKFLESMFSGVETL